MTHKILPYIRNLIPQLPEISRDKISSAAQAAIKQLPWIIGTPLGFGIITTGKMPVLTITGVLLVPSALVAYCRMSSSSSKQKADTILLIVKIAGVASGILCLGYGLHFYYAAALVLKEGLVSAALQNGYLGTLIFLMGLHIKTRIENLPANLHGKLQQIADAIYHDRSDRYYAALDEIGLGMVVPVQQFIDKMTGKNPIDDFVCYLQDHDIEKSVALFPAIFDHSSIWAQWDGHADFKRLLKTLNLQHQIVLYYLDQKYKVPPKTLKSLHPFVSKFTTISSINIDGTSFGESLFVGYRQKLLDAKKSYSELMEKHLAQFENPSERIFVGHALDDLGLTAEEYTSHFSSRQSLIENLNERGVFCLGDLISKNMVARGGSAKGVVIPRIKNFLAGKPLKSVIPQTAHSKVAQIGTAFFNVALTGVTLAMQMHAAPLLTGLGAAYGFIGRDRAINPLRRFLCQPSAQKCRATVERLFQTIFALDTTTHLGKACSFMVGINQGETLRDYLTQACGG